MKEDSVLPVRVSHTRTMRPWALASRWQDEARGCHLRAVHGAELTFGVSACDDSAPEARHAVGSRHALYYVVGAADVGQRDAAVAGATCDDVAVVKVPLHVDHGALVGRKIQHLKQRRLVAAVSARGRRNSSAGARAAAHRGLIIQRPHQHVALLRGCNLRGAGS